jgi:regulation of enolase protein 1 (concanavalin A-like superfamily)
MNDVQDGADAPTAVVYRLDTDTVPGTLTINSSDSYWGTSNCNGVLLCKAIPADKDFTAQVQIVGGDLVSWNGAIDYNCPGLLVRNPDVNAADFVDIWAFDRDNWTAVTLFESWDDDVETEVATADAVSVGDNPWVKLERSGNDFTVYFGPDGVTWTPVADAVTREDLAGMELEIGIAHASQAANVCAASFDNFKLDCPTCQSAGIKAVDYNNNLNVNYIVSQRSIVVSLADGKDINSVQLVSMDGKMISRETVNTNRIEIAAPQNGLYIVLIESNGSNLAKKVVVR